MKKILLCMAAFAVTVGCASSARQNDPEQVLTEQYTRYQILDQEFDNLSVPNDNYNRVAPYEDQINASSYIQSSVSREKNTKPSRTLTVKKTVVDAQGHVLSEASSTTVTDEEVFPEQPGE